MIEFFIPFQVEPKQADRSRIASDPKTGKQWIQHFPQPKVRKNAAELAALVAPFRPPQPLQGPVGLWVTCGYQWRASERRKVIQENDAIYRDTKPDYDNLLKQLGDVLQKSGFVRNDAQIAACGFRKIWCKQGGIHIRLNELTDKITLGDSWPFGGHGGRYRPQSAEVSSPQDTNYEMCEWLGPMPTG